MSILLDNSIDATICIFNYLPSKDLINIGNTCKILFDVTEEKYVKYRKQWENYIINEYWRNNMTGIDVEKICTMTCVCRIKVPVQLDRIDNYFVPQDRKQFMNCKKYCFQNKYLKFFENGNIHLTKCKTINECINMLKFFCDKTKVEIEHITNFRITLLMYSDTFDKPIDLQIIHNHTKSRIIDDMLFIQPGIRILSSGKYFIYCDLHKLKNCINTINTMDNILFSTNTLTI